MTKKKTIPNYDLTSDVGDLEKFLEFKLTLVRQNGRLFAELEGEIKDDGERVTALVPLHDAVCRIVRALDPDYVNEDYPPK